VAGQRRMLIPSHIAPVQTVTVPQSNGMDPSPLYGIECQTGFVWFSQEWGEVK